MMNQKPFQQQQYLLFQDIKFLQEPQYTEKLNAFYKKMYNLKDMQEKKNANGIEEQIEFIEAIKINDDYAAQISQEQINDIISKAQIVFSAQEVTTTSLENLEHNFIIFLLSKNIKLSLMYILIKLISKKADQLNPLHPEIQKFIAKVFDFTADFMLYDEIALQAHALACFKMYEKVQNESNSEQSEMYNENISVKILNKCKKIAKQLLCINLSLEQQARSFLEKYEILTAMCLKSSNYFSNYSGHLLLSSLLSCTEDSYHEAFHSFLSKISLSNSTLISTRRIFVQFSTSQQLIQQIFEKYSNSSVSEQIQFFQFIHDGTFIDICMPYNFFESKYEQLSPSYSEQLKEELISFYKQNVEPLIISTQSFLEDLSPNQHIELIDQFKLQTVFLKNAKLFEIDTAKLYEDLRSSLGYLKEIAPENQIYPYILQNMLTIIICYNHEKLILQDLANLLFFNSKNSSLSKVVRGKIYLLMMYTPNDEDTQDVEEMKQVHLKKKFCKLIKEGQGQAKLEFFLFHCFEIYVNNPNIKEVESDIDRDILDKFLSYISDSKTIIAEKEFCIDSNLQNSKSTSKSFSEIVDNMSKCTEVLKCMSQLKSLLLNFEQKEKLMFTQKLKQMIEETS